MERRELADGGWIALEEGCIPDQAALMEALVGALPLRRETVRVFGKEHLTPRLTSWHGDAGCVYSYSGRTFTPEPFGEALAALRDRVGALAGVRFNSVLASYYRDGADSMGAHSDDEPELGPSRDDVRIASVSLGARRRFVLRHRRSGERHTLELGEGSVLVMGGTLQRHWVHHVPKTRRAVGPRLNLTFRLIRPYDRAHVLPQEGGDAAARRGPHRS